MNLNNIDGILFDMDGTVLDTEGLSENAQILLLNEYNIEATHHEVQEFKGLSYKDFYPRFMAKFKINDDVDTLRTKIRKYLYKSMKNNLEFIKGFEYFYKSTISRGKYKIGLVTNTTRLTYSQIQKYIHIEKYFKFVITATESLKPKPSPSPYLQAMKSLNLKPSQTLIVEDSKIGLLSAVGSKAQVVGITTSLSGDQIRSLNKSIITISTYRELRQLLIN